MTDGTHVTAERPASRVGVLLELLILVAVVGVGFVVWRADQHARAAEDTRICLQRAQATATVALMAPAESVDKDGRIKSIQVLAGQIDQC